MLTKVHFNTLTLRNPFGIHHGNYNYRHQVIVELKEGSIRAFGETVAIDYYGVKAEDLKKACEDLAKKLQGTDPGLSYHAFYSLLQEHCPNEPFVRCAFDEAFHDLKAKMSNQRIWQSLGLPNPQQSLSSITIGLSDSKELINRRVKEAWPFYKLKVKGTLPYELIKRLNEEEKQWGIDANGSFKWGQAPKILREVEELGGIYCEQLCPKGTWEKLEENMANIPHLADESVTDLASAQKVLNQCDGFVLKLTKCGGITPVLDLIKFAKSNGKKLLAGCMTESSIGINHMLALSGQFDYCDLDGAFLISNDEEVAHSMQDGMRVLSENGKFRV